MAEKLGMRITLICLLISGCAAIQRMTNSDGMSTGERREKDALDREWVQAENQRRIDYFAAIKPGQPYVEIERNLGLPSSLEFSGKDGVNWLRRYDLAGTPCLFMFDRADNFLGAYIDRDEIDKRERERVVQRDRQEIENLKSEISSLRSQQVLQGLQLYQQQNQQPQPRYQMPVRSNNWNGQGR